MKKNKSGRTSEKSRSKKRGSKKESGTSAKGSSATAAKKVAAKPAQAKTKIPGAVTAAAPMAAEAVAGTPVFKPEELQPHGNFIESTGQQIIKQLPGIRWTVVTTLQCVTGTVHRLAEGQRPDAGDGDTNFDLYFPVTNPQTGGPSDQVVSINRSIDKHNQELEDPSLQIRHIEVNDGNRISDGVFRLHCEVDPLDLDTQREDLAGMLEDQCYTICGFLVLDSFHAGGLYELHPVETIDRC